MRLRVLSGAFHLPLTSEFRAKNDITYKVTVFQMNVRWTQLYFCVCVFLALHVIAYNSTLDDSFHMKAQEQLMYR